MARIKFGSIITEGHGSLGGHTFQNSKGGAQLRTKPINKQQPSSSQALIRSYNPQLQNGWRNLTEAQRKAWNAYASSFSTRNKLSSVGSLSGHSLWMKYQFIYISNSLTFQPDVYKASIGPFGPEIVKNGNFVNSDYWVPTGSWSISAGATYFSDIDFSYLQQDLVIESGESYRLSYSVSDVLTYGRFWFFSGTGAFIFAPPYQSYINHSSGNYSFDVTASVSVDRIRIYAQTHGSSFSLDDISLKQFI